MSSNQASETTKPINEQIGASNSNDENQFIHELKEKYSSKLSNIVGQIALELVEMYKDKNGYSIKDSIKKAFVEAHDIADEMIAESREFVANVDYSAVIA
jgi:uncharacterized Zn finger protein